MKFKNLWLPMLVSAGVLASGGVFAGSDGWVAQPGKSLDAEWRPAKVAGRDYWQLHYSLAMIDKEGVKDEPFIQDAGIYALRFEKEEGGLEERAAAQRAALAIREMALYDAGGALLPPEDCAVEISCEKPDVQFFYREALRDGNLKTVFVAVGDEKKIAFDETMRVIFTVTPREGRAVQRIVFTDGCQGNGRIGEVAVKVKDGGQWTPVACSTQAAKDRLELTMAQPQRGAAFRIECDTPAILFVIHPEKFPQQARLKKYPFYLFPFWKKYLPNIRPSQMDKAAIEEVEKTYPDTHLGFMLSEWDSTGIGRNPNAVRSQSALEVLPSYSNRVEAYESVKKYFNY